MDVEQELSRLPERTVEVQCGGLTHRVTWSGGRIRVDDHDMEVEATLLNLGGEPPLCLEIAMAWPWADESVTVLNHLAGWSRLEVERITRSEMDAHLRQVEQQLVTRSSSAATLLLGYAKEEIEKRFRRWLLSVLPDGLNDMLAVELVASSMERWEDDDYRFLNRERFEAIVAAKAVPAVQDCMSVVGRRLGPGRTKINCWLTEPGAEASCEGWALTGGAGAAATVPLDWLVRVWARDLAVVDGCLVLDVTREEERSLDVLAARWERGPDGILPVCGQARIALGDRPSLTWT